LRILHLLPNLSGGGAERQFSYLVPELTRMGHSVDVAYINDGPASPNLIGVGMHRLIGRNNYDPYLLWQLIRVIQRIKPDIIHTWILQMDILGGIAAKLNRIPFILREPSSAMAYPLTWKTRLRIRIGSAASAIVSNSQGGDEYWKPRLPKSRRFIVPNGMPIDDIDRVMGALPSGLKKTEAPIVLYAGRLSSDLSANKNLESFLKALACIDQRKTVLGVLCGEGPQRHELERLRDALQLNEKVQFTGYLPISQVWALMKKASVFVSLSAYEGCPNTIMEAMVCGCPLILSDIPAHRELVDDNCALFVKPSDIQQTADSIVRVLSDKNITDVKALIAKQKALKWSTIEMAGKYENVYKKLMPVPRM